MRDLRMGAAVLAVALAALMALAGCQPVVPPAVDPTGPGSLDPSSVLIGCDQAATALTVTVTSHLDPGCTYTGGVTISASNVVLDCQGALVQDPGAQSRGILVTAPTTEALAHVTVRNCATQGFVNGVRISRSGFKTLAPGAEYDQPFSDIVIENSLVRGSRGSGVFVDGYVTGVTLRNLHISDAGSVGIYLEAGSTGTQVLDNTIVHNGWGDVGDAGVPITISGQNFRYHSTGREGIAVDGSRDNVIRGNTIESNAAGGIFLYKNCGEYATQKPDQWWPRRYGANGNLIEGNHITDEPHGVWIASRMEENQYFMDCSDPAYMVDSLLRRHVDVAQGNTVRANQFVDVGYGVRVEDDGNTVEQNSFVSSSLAATAVVVGTRSRSEVLGLPVTGTVVDDNAADLPLTPDPYIAIPTETATTFTANTSAGLPATLVPGVQPTVNPCLFVIDLWWVG